MTTEARMSAKGQITLPREMRDRLGLKSGDELVFTLVDGRYLVTPKNLDFNDLAGLLGDPPAGRATLEEIDETVMRTAGAAALGRQAPEDKKSAA